MKNYQTGGFQLLRPSDVWVAAGIIYKTVVNAFKILDKTAVGNSGLRVVAENSPIDKD